IMVAAIFVPLWVLLARRIMGGGAVDLPPEYRNAPWQPEPVVAEAAAPQPIPASVALTPAVVRWVVASGARAAAAWVAALWFMPVQRHSLQITRTEAIDDERAVLHPAYRGKPWRLLPVAEEGGGPSHR